MVLIWGIPVNLLRNIDAMEFKVDQSKDLKMLIHEVNKSDISSFRKVNG